MPDSHCVIPLGTGRYEALVSVEDFGRLTEMGLWHAHDDGKGRIYATTVVRMESGKRKRLYMHRVIAMPPKGYVVDHINGDSLDNRRENLRVCQIYENNANRVWQTVTGFRGIRKHGPRWQARFRGKSLGMFDTPEEAAAAWDRAVEAHCGPFAALNFPRSGAPCASADVPF